MVDASVVALVERRELEVIATLDQRHFRVARPRHVEAFTLVL
jgi:predicted nucleic acid-binding protein